MKIWHSAHFPLIAFLGPVHITLMSYTVCTCLRSRHSSMLLGAPEITNELTTTNTVHMDSSFN